MGEKTFVTPRGKYFWSNLQSFISKPKTIMFPMARKFTLAETAGQLILASCDVYILGYEKTFVFSQRFQIINLFQAGTLLDD